MLCAAHQIDNCVPCRYHASRPARKPRKVPTRQYERDRGALDPDKIDPRNLDCCRRGDCLEQRWKDGSDAPLLCGECRRYEAPSGDERTTEINTLCKVGLSLAGWLMLEEKVGHPLTLREIERLREEGKL